MGVGGRVVKQRPPHVWVRVHVEPVGQGSPPRVQEESGGGPAAIARLASQAIMSDFMIEVV